MNDSVQFAKSLFLPGGFELSDYIDGKCDVTTVTGIYSCLTVDMSFKRQLSYYILTIYVPTLMIVMVSWLSFWLDHKSVSVPSVQSMMLQILHLHPTKIKMPNLEHH